MDREGWGLIGLVLGTLFIIAVIAFSCLRGFAVEPQTAIEAAETIGFTDVTVTDENYMCMAWQGCDRNDAVGFEMTATNAQGERVDIMVCCGWPFKGCTIRTN